MKTTEEPTSGLGQTLEWLRKELVRLCISFYLTPSPHIVQGPWCSLGWGRATGWGVGPTGSHLGSATPRTGDTPGAGISRSWPTEAALGAVLARLVLRITVSPGMCSAL